jgi:hypothetical protein
MDTFGVTEMRCGLELTKCRPFTNSTLENTDKVALIAVVPIGAPVLDTVIY